MTLGAAAEASATSGWFEGWIGGLVAAAITLAFSAWWETRQSRRRRLEEALSAVASTADALWFHGEGAITDSRPFFELTRAYVRAILLLQRRPIRRRSRRLALANRLNRRWSALQARPDGDWKGRRQIAVEMSALCLGWLSDPRRTPRERLTHSMGAAPHGKPEAE